MTNQPIPVRGIRRLIYLALALLFLVLGLIGIVLPGLPTTPFLLFMSYFLIRTSPQLHDQIIRWPLVGKPIREWEEKRGVRPHIKILACLMVAILVTISMVSNSFGFPIKVSIGVLAAIGIFVVWRLPTIR